MVSLGLSTLNAEILSDGTWVFFKKCPGCEAVPVRFRATPGKRYSITILSQIGSDLINHRSVCPNFHAYSEDQLIKDLTLLEDKIGAGR